MFRPILIIILNICLSYALLSQTAHADEALPLEYFTKKGDYLDVKISPDGLHLAARLRHSGTVYLVFTRLSDGEVVGGVRPRKENEIRSVRWVSNKRVIYTFAEKSYLYDSAGGTGELFATDIDDDKSIMLAGYRAGDDRLGRKTNNKDDTRASYVVINELPNDDRHVLVAEYPWARSPGGWYKSGEKPTIVSKLDIYTGRKLNSETMPYNGGRPYASDSGEVNFITWSDDYIDAQAAVRSKKGEPWEDISTIIGDDKKKFVVSHINRAGTKVYLRALIGKAAITTLYEFELATKKLTRVFNNEFGLNYYSYDNDKEPFVSTSYPNREHYDYSQTKPNSPFIKIHKTLLTAFGGQEIQITSKSDDGKRIIVRVDSSSNPGEYYLFDTVTKEAKFIFANLSWIDPREMVATTPISLKARDGLTLNGYITMPKGVKSDAPLIVLPHGGPHGVRDYHSFDSEVQMFANFGYAVLRINFRGSGGYGDTFEELGYRQWGKSMVDDVIDATQWAIEEGYANKDRICIYGASYGGFSALMSAARAPDLYQCAIGYVGVYDLPTMKVKGDIPIGFKGKRYLERVLGDNIDDLIEQSPITHVDKIKSGVLLIHGDKDRRVPSVHATKMRKALKKAGNPPEWLYLGDVGHGARSEENLNTVYTSILSFLEKHISAPKQ